MYLYMTREGQELTPGVTMLIYEKFMGHNLHSPLRMCRAGNMAAIREQCWHGCQLAAGLAAEKTIILLECWRHC